MRIIDKQNDYYDYLQDSSDTLVFDRRGSFLLTKEIFCSRLKLRKYNYHNSPDGFALLQCGATFWLLLVSITEWNEHNPLDYQIQFITTWKNYDKDRELLKFDFISINGIYDIYDYKNKRYDYDSIIKRIDDIKSAINNNNYNIDITLSYNNKITQTSAKKGYWEKEEQTIPILKACGIADIISPINIFCAIEEYFSLEKTDSEKTEPIGATNDDKIIMHGFDTKSSFRGRQIVN